MEEIEMCGKCLEYKPVAMDYEFSGGWQDRGYLCYDCAYEVLEVFDKEAANALPLPDGEVVE